MMTKQEKPKQNKPVYIDRELAGPMLTTSQYNKYYNKKEKDNGRTDS